MRVTKADLAALVTGVALAALFIYSIQIGWWS